MNDLKPGWQTSEFLNTLLHSALAIGVSAGLVSQTDATTTEGMLVTIVGLAIALGSNVLVAYHYLQSRTTLKGLPAAGAAIGPQPLPPGTQYLSPSSGMAPPQPPTRFTPSAGPKPT